MGGELHGQDQHDRPRHHDLGFGQFVSRRHPADDGHGWPDQECDPDDARQASRTVHQVSARGTAGGTRPGRNCTPRPPPACSNPGRGHGRRKAVVFYLESLSISFTMMVPPGSTMPAKSAPRSNSASREPSLRTALPSMLPSLLTRPDKPSISITPSLSFQANWNA